LLNLKDLGLKAQVLTFASVYGSVGVLYFPFNLISGINTMPMGIVNDEEFLRQVNNTIPNPELKRDNVKIPELVIEPLETPGRKEGDNNVPDSLRALIGSTAHVEGRKSALELASLFGISASSTSAYAHGNTSTKSYDKEDKKIVDVITSRKARITKRALHKLQSSLHHITNDKLQLLDAKELASVSKDMSAVVKNMEPANAGMGSDGSGAKFVIFTPEVRMENSYESITVNE